MSMYLNRSTLYINNQLLRHAVGTPLPHFSTSSQPESEHAPLSFANEGQFLLVSAASFDAIRDAHARVRGAEPNPAEFVDDGALCCTISLSFALLLSCLVSYYSECLDVYSCINMYPH
jgi:hypothetical protein